MVLRDIMEACTRFTGLIDRWNGVLIPDDDAEDDEVETVIQARQQDVNTAKEVSQDSREVFIRFADRQEIFERLSDFFKALVESQKPPSSTGDASGPSGSFTRTARAAQIVQSSRVISRHTSFAGKANMTGAGSAGKTRTEQSEKGMEVESMMGRHIEQREYNWA